MRKDAVVLEIRKKTAVVLASDGRFLRVRNRNYQVGQRIAETEQAPVRLRPMLRRTLLVAACLVLALGSSALAVSKWMVWSYAGVDVGEISVNYSLNFRNEVLSAEGNSEKADQLIGSLERIPYEPVDSAVERLMDAAGEEQAEASEEPEVVICVASFMGGTGRTEDRIMEGVDRSMEKSRPEASGEERREDVRVERLEWRDAKPAMEERHHPQSTQNPADREEERQQPEETNVEATEKLPANQPADAPQSTPAMPEAIDEQPALTPATPEATDEQPVRTPAVPEAAEEQPAREQDTSGPIQEEHPTNAPEADHSTGSPEQQPADHSSGSLEQQPADRSAGSPVQEPADRSPENDTNRQNSPESLQKPPESGEQRQAEPSQPQPRP